jgi:hypothetical protein
MMARYWTGMFILMRRTIDTKYMPMIWDRSSTTKLELLGLEIQMKNLDMVRRRPRVEDTTMAPTCQKINVVQGTLTEGEGSVQLTSSLKIG